MPLWLQLTTAVSSAITSGLMGAALVPFLQKKRFCEPYSPNDGEEKVQHRLRPTMCGLLLVFGTLIGYVLSYSLYRTFCVMDSTSLSVQTETKELLLGACYALICAVFGFLKDLQLVRRKQIWKVPVLFRFSGVFVLTVGFLLLCGSKSTVLDFGFWQYNAGILYIPLTAAAGSFLWLFSSEMEENTDGVCISVGGIILLGMAILLMQIAANQQALFSLAAAGACMGCLVWNLHPAKCRLGMTGSFWMSGILTAVCLMSRQHLALLLMLAVYLMNVIPSWRKQGSTLQEQMRKADMKPWQVIAVLAGFAGFCCAVAVMVYA